jgi:protocatechuate 3,4-dioxygenase beta subunit
MPRTGCIDPARAPRRRFLRAATLAAIPFLVAAAPRALAEKTLPLTPAQTEGPFYPRTIPADHDADLTEIAGHGAPATGTRLYFTGRVLAPDGKPHAGATVELWQCDAHGRYHHVGDDASPRDDGFQGYGVAIADAEGRYAFKTIRPVAYTGRVPHMHVKVRTAAGATLTTQVYVKGDRTAGDPVLAWSPKGTLELLTMALAPALGREPGALAGNFDIVVR